MKRLLTASVLTVALLATVRAEAQHDQESMLLTFNVAYWRAKSAISQDAVDGFGFGLPLEALTLNGRITAGLFFGFYAAEDRIAADPAAGFSEPEDVSYRNWPLMLTSRYFFGSDSVIGYVGAGIGFTVNVFEHWTSERSIRESRIGFTVSVPVGMMVWVSDTLFFNIGYSLSYVSSSFLDPGLANVVSVGVGFEFARSETKF